MVYNKYPQYIRNQAARMAKEGHSLTEISEWLMSKGYQGRNGRLSTTSVQSMMGSRKKTSTSKPLPKTIIRRAVNQTPAPTVQETAPVVQKEEAPVVQSQGYSSRFDREFYMDLVLKSDYLGANEQIARLKEIRGVM